MASKLAVIVPMYNEEDGAFRCVTEMQKVLLQCPSAALFVVNDGSTDATLSVLKKILSEGKAPKFHLVDMEKNGGYGQACLTGAHAARREGFEFGLFMDSDLTNNPEMIPVFLKVLSSDLFDMVKGSRYIQGGGMDGVPQYRQWITILGNQVASLLFGIGVKDCTNGFRAVRLSFLEGETFAERGFPVILEELYLFKKKGARFKEIPYTLTARKADQGTSKFNYKPSIFWAYLKYALRATAVKYTRKTN